LLSNGLPNPEAGSTFCSGGTNFTVPTCDPVLTNPCLPGTSPTPCPGGQPSQPANDANNLVCQHFTLTVAAAGAVSACIVFPGGAGNFNTVDIFVVQLNAAGQAVAVVANTSAINPSPGPTPGTLQVCAPSFTAAAGTTFEVQLNPSFLTGPIPTGSITGTITFTPSTAGGTGGPPPPPSGAKFTGGGQGQGTDPSTTTKINLNVFDMVTTKGKVRYQLVGGDGSCAVRSTSFSTVSVTGTGSVPGGSGSIGSTHVTGNGNDLNGNPVGFDLTANDNGEGSSQTTPDSYSIKITNANGVVVCQQGNNALKQGNLQYHPS
jgi:hypothetical protein